MSVSKYWSGDKLRIEMMSPVKNKEHSAIYNCYLQLRELIITGELPPRKKLKIDELRGILNMGASPVREALGLLTSDMLVERLDQRGFRVSPVSQENFNEILNLRCSLEVIALRASIANADEDWENNLVLKHHKMQQCKRQQKTQFELAHKAFHFALLQNSKMPILERYCSQLYDLNIRYRNIASADTGYDERNVEYEHQTIFDAALEKDANAASTALVDHYCKTSSYLTSRIINNNLFHM
jgi:GntR family carbon starvation induced transcriptional regulator